MPTAGKSIDEIIKESFAGLHKSLSRLKLRIQTRAERPPTDTLLATLLAIPPGRLMRDIDHENEIATSYESVQAKRARYRKFLQRENEKEEKENPPNVEDYLQVHLIDPDDPDNPEGSSLHILDYLAKDEWIQQKVSAFDNPNDPLPRIHQNSSNVSQYWATRNDISPDEVSNFSGLKKDLLRPWQKIGVVKLLKSCESPLGGMILADATGMGKSLTALVAALEKRKQMLPHCGPILVVTRPNCTNQWFNEIRTHFSEVSASKAGHGTEI